MPQPFVELHPKQREPQARRPPHCGRSAFASGSKTVGASPKSASQRASSFGGGPLERSITRDNASGQTFLGAQGLGEPQESVRNGQSAHDRRLSFPPGSGVSRHVAPAVRMLQMHPTSLSRARVSVRQPSQPATAPLFESCSVRKRARFFAHDGAPRGAWCSGHRLARAEWLRRGSVHLVRPAFRPAPTHSCTRASYAPF